MLKNFKFQFFGRTIPFVLACSMILFGFPGQSVGLCALTESILSTSDLSRNMYSAIYLCATITGCFLVLFSSNIIDRFKSRTLSLSVLMIWAILFLIVGHGDVLYEKFFINFTNKKIYFVVFLYVSLSLLRFFGQNLLPVLGRIQIIRVFENNQGSMIAWNGIFVSIITGYAPRIMRSLSDNTSWFTAYKNLSIIGFIFFFISWALLRDPSGKIFRKKMDVINNSLIKNSFPQKKLPEEGECIEIFSRKKLLKSPIFWCLTITLCINSLIGSGLTVHIVDVFRESQKGESLAINSYLYLSIATIIASPIFGNQVDKNRIKASIIVLLCFQFFGLVGLEISKNFVGFWAYVMCIGASWGGYAVLIAAAWTKLFGKKNLPLILGVVQFFSSIVGAISVFLMSFFKWLFGSYFYMIHAIEIIIIATMIFVIKKFKMNSEILLNMDSERCFNKL